MRNRKIFGIVTGFPLFLSVKTLKWVIFVMYLNMKTFYSIQWNEVRIYKWTDGRTIHAYISQTFLKVIRKIK